MSIRTNMLCGAILCMSFVPAAFAQVAGTDAPAMDANQAAMQTKDMQKGPNEADMKGMENLTKLAAMPEKAGDGLFVLDNAMGNLFEIEFSKLAQSKSQDEGVKTLAAEIIKDHTTANDNLKPIAEKMGLALPTMLPSHKQLMLQVYSAMAPADFDTCYLLEQKQLHAKDVTSFADHAKAVKDEDLRHYVTMTLPHLKMHGAHIVQVASGKGYPTPLGGGAGGEHDMGAMGGMNGGMNGTAGMPGDPHDTPAGGRPSRDPTAPANNQNPSNR